MNKRKKLVIAPDPLGAVLWAGTVGLSALCSMAGLRSSQWGRSRQFYLGAHALASVQVPSLFGQGVA